MKSQQDARQPGKQVAPHWGAWIEIINCNVVNPSRYVSHPTGVRGLKLHIVHLPRIA